MRVSIHRPVEQIKVGPNIVLHRLNTPCARCLDAGRQVTPQPNIGHALLAFQFLHQISLTFSVGCCALHQVGAKIEYTRLEFLVKMQGPEFQIVNLDQHLELRGKLRGVNAARPALRASARCQRRTLLMRAKLKNKGDLAGVSSRPKWRSARTLPPGRLGRVQLTAVSESCSSWSQPDR